MNRKAFSILLLIALIAIGAGSQALAQSGGAGLFLSPPSGAYAVGKTFTVKVMADSGGVAAGINAAEGQIKFDPQLLTVSKISDASTIFKLWTTEPTYSNSAGTISFGGGSPGAYKGAAGEIFNVTFTAKKSGEAAVTWSNGVVLAADGRGTNVFGGFGNGKYTISEPDKADEPKPAADKKEPEKPKGNLPPQPEISSKSHPSGDIWYADSDPAFSWRILSDMTGVSYGISVDPAGDPGDKNDGLVENAEFQDQADGEWHFHLKYQNQFGWGRVAHYKFKIDATPPEAFVVTYDSGRDTTDPSPKLIFKTTDKSSGLSHYLVSYGPESRRAELSELDRGYYQLPPLKPGEYAIGVAAYDQAGNSASSTLHLMIDPLKSPIITSIPKIHSRKDELIIRGTSFYPNVTVKIHIGRENAEAAEFEVSTDHEGNWTFFHKGDLDKGLYEVWAKLIDGRGAESLESTRHAMTVIAPSILESFCGWIIAFLALLIALLFLAIVYREKANQAEKARVLREADEVKLKLAKIFAALREEVDELIALADKRPGLSESERRVKEKLQESLDISEEFIAKEIEDVEKEIRVKKKKSF